MEPTKSKTTAKDFFFYFGMMIALYASVISLINLYLAMISHAFPDVYGYIDPYSAGVRAAIATLVVMFPVYMYLMHHVMRAEAQEPEKRELGVRKWLIYLTLFVGAVTLVIDLIVLLNRFLGGTDFTMAFILKAITVFVIVGAVFAYYVYDLRHPPVRGDMVRKWAIYGSTFVVVASLILGFVVMGSPASQRTRVYDNQRVSDLQNINSQIINYWQTNQELPANLTDITNTASGYPLPTDPETKQPYTYTMEGSLSYQLCATFGLADQSTVGIVASPDTWNHPAGHYCFDRTINPNVTPPYPKGAAVIPPTPRVKIY